MSDLLQTILPVPALVRLTAELTGLHLGVLPSPSPGRSWDLCRLVAGCRPQARRRNCALDDSICRSCAQRHLRKALASPQMGHRFEEPCGVGSFLLPVMGIAGPVGLLTLRQEAQRGARDAISVATSDREARFRRAVRLLRDMARVPSRRGGFAEAVGLEEQVPAATNEARSYRVVRSLIERLSHEFACPVSLKAVAAESGLNASYLSTIFVREAGQPFKCYLTALRMEHAQALLNDPQLPVAEIAGRVGYATPHRFRAAFRAKTGLSPSRWRAARQPQRAGD